MITPQEKLKLMLELGLESAASKWAEINNLTVMKFRTITEEKIEELLSAQYDVEVPFKFEPVVAMTLVGLFIGAFLSIRLDPRYDDVLHFSWKCFGIINVIAQIIGWFFARPRIEKETAIICDIALEDWEDNLPYGALLSIKEAKQQGFKNFTIHFPATQESEYGQLQRLKNDPIITAQKKGSNKLYNIFAWDDSKIYE